MKKKIILLFLLPIFLFSQEAEQKKVKLRSMILPGWGEKTLGADDRAQGFFKRDAVLWLLYLAGKKSADWYESDYRAFAELHADVDMDNKDYLFAVNMGQYDSLEEFNDIYDRRRLIEEKYPEGQSYGWHWDSTSNRRKFNDLRIKSVTRDKYARFTAAGLVIHRVISFIDVLYLERTGKNLMLESGISGTGQSVQLNFTLNF